MIEAPPGKPMYREVRGSLMQRLLKSLAVATTLVMFIVLVMGALVTNTGSGHGCSNTWPLCNGKFIPEFTVAALIEWSHRTVTALVTVLILALSAGTLALYRRRREAQVLVPLMIVFLMAQAVLGAIAAGVHETAAVLALHFGVSLISFASIVLTTAFVFEAGGADTVRDRPVPARLRLSILGLIVFTYVVTYLGAYTRHSGASLACLDWPLCGQRPFSTIPSMAWLVTVQEGHRVVAALLALAVAGLWLVARRDRAERPDLYRGATAALVTVVLQSLAGGLVVLSRLDLFTTLLHAALVSLLFASLAYLVYHLIPRRVCLPRRASAPPVRSGAVAAGAK